MLLPDSFEVSYSPQTKPDKKQCSKRTPDSLFLPVADNKDKN